MQSLQMPQYEVVQKVEALKKTVPETHNAKEIA
jgi:hypothetical protein